MKTKISTVFCKAYSAETPTASMRKLGPVALAAERDGLATIVKPEEMDISAKLRKLHDPAYVDAFITGEGRLASSNGFTWTPQIRDGVLAMNRGQLTAAKLALKHGVAASVTQGAHHATYWSGGGFCTFCSLALVASEMPDKKIMVIDVDQHSGNGTAAFTERLKNLWNFTIFGSDFGDRSSKRNFRRHIHGPVDKDFSHYKRAIWDAFKVARRIKPDLILLNAGVDCCINDPMGSVGATPEQLKERDRMVFQFCKDNGIPVCFSLAGGYTDDMDALVKWHCNTWRAAVDVFSK